RYTDQMRNVDFPPSFYNIDQLVSPSSILFATPSMAQTFPLKITMTLPPHLSLKSCHQLSPFPLSRSSLFPFYSHPIPVHVEAHSNPSFIPTPFNALSRPCIVACQPLHPRCLGGIVDGKSTRLNSVT